MKHIKNQVQGRKKNKNMNNMYKHTKIKFNDVINRGRGK